MAAFKPGARPLVKKRFGFGILSFGRDVTVGSTSSCSADCALFVSGSAVVESVGRPLPLALNPGRGRTTRDGASDTTASLSDRSVVVVLAVVLTDPLRLNRFRARMKIKI